MKKMLIVFFLIVFCSFFTACFSPWEGDEGMFRINFGSAFSSRAASSPNLDYEYIMMLTHTVTLSGGPGPEQSVIIPPGTLTANFTVTPGRWDILIIAEEIQTEPYDDDSDGVADGIRIYNHGIAAKGSASVEIKPGPNGPVSIKMELPEPEKDI